MTKNILDRCLIKEETFNPESIGGKIDVTIRQLTAGEGLEYQSILRDSEKKQEDAVFFAVKCAMVKPTFFTDEELKKVNITGRNLIYEIHGRLPTIGMTVSEKKEYLKKLQELSQKLENSKIEDEEDTTEKK